MKPSNDMLSVDARVPRARGTSLHRQLFMVLRDEILRGSYPSGLLPKEEALCERFDVSRITVRRALADLAAEGLVESRHGRGTFVREDRLPMARERPSLSLIDSLRQAAIDTNVQVLQVEQVEAPLDVASMLQLVPGEKAVHALRLRSIDDTPVMLTDAWVPTRFGKQVTAASLRKHALYEILLAQGVKFGRVIQEITTQVCDPLNARLMKTEVGMPLLRVVRVIHDQESRPVQYIAVTMTPERSRILMDIPGDAVNTLSAGQFVHDITKRISE
ncbi:Transcriptional regulator, GntR family-like protein [Cupriavidus oxalaticus]|uniref:Transcriptional regulator, GntR family-like protein n=3 Tax=Cupriavidus oxalaticus TaxID=96344 RepID=A0A375GHA6_9BURK|nr:Transcriptional regulator, GntR family-like protein [Cupriavidus oxalaticus]SPC18166.1 Transcriptional regulator, GntR family-like protein [Cupriavidus oxalaticus]